MLSSASARYATSLLELAAERGEVDSAKADMDVLARTITAEPQLARALASPVIPSEKKMSVLQALFGERFNPLVMQFFVLLSKRNRESLIEEIAQSFISQYLAQRGTTQATVISATPLDEAALTQAQALGQKLTGMKVELTQKLDPTLLGGFILRAGDRQLDQSVSSRLARLRRELAAA